MTKIKPFTCPACGAEHENLDGLIKHAEACQNLKGSGYLGSHWNEKTGPVYGTTARKPSLEDYER